MFMKKVYNGFDTASEIEPTAWREVLRIINEGTVEGLSQAPVPPTHDELFYRELRHSNEIFAAFKVHTMGNEMAAKLYDANGNLKPFDKWARDVSSIASHQVGSWLQTEYDTAVIRAHAAADWKEFERNRDIMPNLRWMPTTSPEPESSHRQYWQMGLTLPIDDPFWNDHHPGDRWNCKCSLEATDEPVNRPDDMEPTKPQRGLENNPGKDGHTFNDSHPYFPKDCNHCPVRGASGFTNKLKSIFENRKKDCYNCPYINGCLERTDVPKKKAKEVREEVAFLTEQNFTHPKFEHEVGFSKKSIKEWTNQPHEHYHEKNAMLYGFKDIFYNSTYMGPTKDAKHRPNVVASHIFETHIRGDKTWIIVHEFDWGQFTVYSISDNPKVLQGIKNKSL